MKPLRHYISSLRTDAVKALQVFNLMRFGATLLIGILLAKSGIPTADISLYETWLFFGNIVTFFWMGGGQNALIALFPKLGSPEERGSLLFQSFAVFNLLAILAGLALVMSGGWIGERFAQSGEIPHLWWLCLFILGNVPSQLVHLFYLLQEKPPFILRYGMLAFGLQLAAVLAPVYLGFGIEAAFIGLAVWALLKWIWLLVLTLKYGRWEWKPGILKPYAWAMLPLTLHVLVGNSVEYTDGLIVAGYFEDGRQFALFRFGARELPLTMLLVGGIVTGLIPVASRNLGEGMAEIRRRTASLSHWLFPLSAALMALSPFAFPFFYNADFVVSAKVFNIYLLILSSRILLPQVAIIARQRNFVLVGSALLETALNIGLSLWWVRIWGLEGIAMASVAAFLVNKLNLILYNYYVLGIAPGSYIPVKTWALYTFGLAIVYLLINWTYG